MANMTKLEIAATFMRMKKADVKREVGYRNDPPRRTPNMSRDRDPFAS